MAEDPQLKSTKAMIRSVLISEKDGVPASKFMRDYEEITGEQIPFKKFGHSSLDQFIRSIPDVVFVRGTRGGEVTYFAVADETTAHIQKLVSKQRSKRPKPMKKGPTRRPKAHSQIRKSFASRGGFSGPYRPVPGFRTPAKPKPKKAASPQAVGFSSADVSPLMVTVRKTSGEVDERLIERKAVSINGGKKMASRALKAAFGEKPSDKKFNKNYELPPRFQRVVASSSASSSSADKPVAVVNPSPQRGDGPALSEDQLPKGCRSWVTTLLKDFPNGLWSTRFLVLYKDKFGEDAPSTLIDIISSWTDIAKVEMNIVADRHVLYPAPQRSSRPTTPDLQSQPAPPRRPQQPTPVSQRTPSWQDFNVPDAELLPTEESKYVYVAYSVDLGHFYVQDEQSCVDDITAQLGALCKDQVVPQMSDLHAGAFCAALYSEDNNWYRARVCYMASEAEIQVFFIDYGNVEKVPLSNIRCLTKETAEIPAQAINCTLFGLKPLSESGWSQEALNYFHEFVADKKIEVVTYGYSEGQCVVELFSEEAGDESLNQRLFEAGLVGTSLKDEEQVEETDGEPADLELPDAEFVEIVLAYVDFNMCIIRLAGPNYSEKLEAYEDYLGTLYKAAESSGKPKNLGPESVCIASVDLLFHRVRILKLEVNEAQCVFVDHGYQERIPLNQLQPLDPEVNRMLAYQAVPCALAGLEHFMKLPTTMRELIQMCQNKICMAEIVCRDPLTVMLYDTSSEEDININKEIARKLAAEGAKVDMEIFNTDSVASESSGASSPRTQSSLSVTTDVEQLQSAAQKLSLAGGTGDGGGMSGTVDAVAGGGVQPGLQTQQQQQQFAQQYVQHQHPPPPPPLQTQQQQQQLYTWGAKEGAGPYVANPSPATPPVRPPHVSAQNPLEIPPPRPLSPTSATKYRDSLNVAYHTWPLPGYVPLPGIGEFFDVYIHWISDPSNFVIMPHTMLPQLEKLMTSINSKFQPARSQMMAGGDASQGLPTVVPDPQVDHLYLGFVDGLFYRAIFKGDKEFGLHVFLPDYCTHHLVDKTDLYFLPKQFWSLPFAAYKACLYGVNPTGRQWLESAKYKFVQMALNKTLVALVKSTEGSVDFEESDGGMKVAEQRLHLHLVDTSDSERDIVLAEELVDLGLAESAGV